jgi:hypothetical protein
MNKRQTTANSLSEDSNGCRKEYNPYTPEEFPAQDGLCPKLKYSNHEKNLIKRQRYDNNINSENNKDNIVYCDFDVSNIQDSESDTRPERTKVAVAKN